MAIIYKHRKEPVPKLPPHFSELQPLLQKLLAKRPEERFASAREAGDAIEDALLTVSVLERS